MNAKNFFKHTGLAAGYLTLFLLLQYWVSFLFTAGLTIRNFAMPHSLEDLFSLIDYTGMQAMQFYDVITLLIYAACLLFYGCLLFAEQPDAPLKAARLVMPRRKVMLWAPVVLGVGFFFSVQGYMVLIPEDSLLMQQYQDAVAMLEYGIFPVLSAFVTVFGAPLVEEIIFRRFVFRAFLRGLPKVPAFACLLSGPVFAVVHGNLAATLPLIFLGFLFAWVYFRTGRIWTTMLIHSLFNATTVVAMLVFPGLAKL